MSVLMCRSMTLSVWTFFLSGVHVVIQCRVRPHLPGLHQRRVSEVFVCKLHFYCLYEYMILYFLGRFLRAITQNVSWHIIKILAVPLHSKICYANCYLIWIFELYFSEWCMYKFDRRCLFLLSSAEGGQFLLTINLILGHECTS